MSKAGDMIENPVTGERVVVRVGTEDSRGELLEIDAYVRSGGAVTGEHVHPAIEEYFTVVRGRVGFRLNGREAIAEPGERLHVPAGMAHDWWNAGEEEAHVIVEISPGERFEEMAVNLFGLAQDGKTNSKGMPNLLQAAIFAGSLRMCCISPSLRCWCSDCCSVLWRQSLGSWATEAGTRSTADRSLRVTREPAHRPQQG